MWRAKVANHRFFATYDEERATCSGKGMDLDQVWTSCLGEALERYSASCWSDDVLYQAPRSSLDGRSIDPRDLVLFTDEQYPALPYLPYDDAASISWVRGRSLVDDDLVWVPAIAALMDYPVRDEHEFLFGITSNGLAAGASLQDAILGALCEVLERDAALISWYNRLPGQPYDALTHPDEDIRNLAQLYARRGVELALIRLPTDHPVTVFVGIALQSEGTSGPSAVVGLGADMNPAIAARKAALEVGQVRPSIRRRARSARKQMDDLAANPLTVETMEDHALLYAHPTGGDALRFLFGEPQHWQQPGCASPQCPLSFLIDHFRRIGQEVVYIDLTPPDMRSLGIYTARVIVPGFQPISFGQSERRLGGRRLFEFPVAQGIRSAELSIAELNPLPHPIA